MKIGIYGPDWRDSVLRLNDANEFETEERPPYELVAETLGDAVRQYESLFYVSISPYDGSDPDLVFREDFGPRYFVYSDSAGDQMLVDIHIRRGSEEVCPKQDLNYPLQDGDILDIMGMLVC